MAQLARWLAVVAILLSCSCILTASASTSDDDSTIRTPTTTATTTSAEAETATPPGTAADHQKPKDTADDNEEDDLPDENFTPEQLARAGENLGRLFDEVLDANSDGRVTRAELTAWLAAAERERADKDIDEAWQMYASYRDDKDNDTTGSSSNNSRDSNENKAEKNSLLDWQTFADARAAAAADLQEQPGQPSPELQAEVRRAIEEASRETGLDKAGIKVSLPGGDLAGSETAAGNNKAAAAGEGSKFQRQFALELARDRRRWEAADANGDGRLSRREFAAFALAEPPPRTPSGTKQEEASAKKLRRVLALEALERLDTDGDGRASLKEFLVGGAAANDASGTAGRAEDEKNFRNVWDVNKDGYLDADEMEKMLATLDGMDTGGAEEADEEAARLMKAADTDGDGSLSKAEMLASLSTFAGSAGTNYGDSVGIHDEL